MKGVIGLCQRKRGRKTVSTVKTKISSLLAASILALAGCSSAAASDSPVKKTSWQKDMAHIDQKSAEFAEKVELFYQALEKRDWPTSYDMRTAAFKQMVTREHYLKQMTEGGKVLDNHKVLSSHTYSMNGDDTAAEVIIEFNPGGGGVHSYNCARWIKRDGKWMCDEPGLSGLLISLSPPDWTWKIN
jgi:hypothetical protein